MSKDNQNTPPMGDDAELHQRLMMLDWDIEPDRDLWDGIVSKMGARSESGKENAINPKVFNQGWMPYAVAASFLVAVVSLLFSYVNFNQTREMEVMQAAYVMHQQSQLELIEQQHRMVRAQFMNVLEARKDKLDKEFFAEIEMVLETIDSAAAELRAAIIEQPYNSNYSVMLVKAYQQEIKLLNKIKFKDEELSI